MKKILLLLIALLTTAYAGNPDYEAGYEAMQDQKWQESFEFFKQAENDKEITDASYYWQGYVLFKMGQKAQAKRILKRLIKKHPNSRWTDDAKLLLLENNKQQVNLNDVTLDEDLKLYAIQQIYFNNPEKGLPLLQELLKKSQKKSTKMNALNILGISDSDTATETLHQFIMKEKNQDLLNKAIQMLSLRNNKNSDKILMKLYKNNANKELKGSIIHGFIYSDRNTVLVDLLKKETDEESRLHMINILGIKGATGELKRLYDQTQDVDEKLAMIHALAIAGDGQFIMKTIEKETDPNINSAAIHAMIIIDDKETQDYLVRLYKTNQNQETKQQIINAFIAIDLNSHTILELIKDEQDMQNKKSLIRVLMTKDDSESLLKVYESNNDEEIRASVIRQLGAMGGHNELINLFALSQEESQHQIVRALGMSESINSTEFLLGLFNTGNARMQQAVIQSFIMQDDAKSLIVLLKQASGQDIKKQLIRAIGITDSDALDRILNN